MKKLFSAIALTLFLCTGVYAANCSVSGIYNTEYDFSLDGKIDGKVQKSQIKFNPSKKKKHISVGQYTAKYREHVFRVSCLRLEKNALSMVYTDKGNGYQATYTMKESGAGKYVGAWSDVRGNQGDFVMTKGSGDADPLKSKHMSITKQTFSMSKDGVIKITYNLPGYQDQKICVEQKKTPKDKVTNCKSVEIAGKKKGTEDMYVPFQPGDYEIRVYYAKPMKEQTTAESNRFIKDIKTLRDKLAVKAEK